MGFKGGVIVGPISLSSTGSSDIIIDSDDTLLLDADGVLELNSSAGAISIGNDANAQAINIGTGAAARTITIGNTTGSTDLDLRCGTGDFTLASATGTIISALDSGEVRKPLQPAFLANHSVAQNNITGNGTTATINFTTEIFDQNGDYNGTNTFTAPITGRYILTYCLLLNDPSTATHGLLIITTSNRIYLSNSMMYGNITPASGSLSLNFSQVVDMDASDTAICQIQVSGVGSDTVNAPQTGNHTFFGGYLIC